MDWKETGVHSEGLQDFTLWDIQATAPGFQNPFLVLDLIRLQASPRELFERFELREARICGGVLAIGSALDQLTHLPKNPAQNPSPTWRLGLLEISGVRASLGENAWRAESDITFTIATTFQNLTPSEITNKLGATEQSIELSNLAIPSPRDPFTHVLKLRIVLIQFTLAGLLDQEITGLNGVRHTEGSPRGSEWGFECMAGKARGRLCPSFGSFRRNNPTIFSIGAGALPS